MQNNIKLQYQGYAKTSLLWTNDLVEGLKQFPIHNNDSGYHGEINYKMRLGFRVERFVGSDLRNMKDVEILEENIQVKNKKRTIGELDCLLKYKGQPIHLEIIFKLYLYDESVGNSEIEHWIGGNRRDSLHKKLTKLKEKQLPLLYHPSTQPILAKHNLKAEDFEQRVHFRAQLYVPFKKEVQFYHLNENCLKGFYIRPQQLERFHTCKFFFPYKRDWLIDPQIATEWLSYLRFKIRIDEIMNHPSYPLCWIKYPNGEMEKFFVVWWD